MGSALLFYFGWVRTSIQAHELGYDASVVGHSTQDYILKSINVLFVPLVLLLLVALLLHWLHQRLVQSAAARPRLRARVLRVARISTLSWIIWIPLGIVIAVFSEPAKRISLPATLTLALLCALYGNALERRFANRRSLPSGRALILVLLAFAVFWDTERLARAMGEGYADQISADPTKLSAVTIYSPRSLGISADSIVETKLSNPDAAYLYRYDGFRLLERSGNRFFLMNEHWDGRNCRVFILPDNHTMRIEFSRAN
jgi:hypothetical protein